MPADLGVLGAMLSVGLRQLASEQQAEYQRITGAVHVLRAALAAGDQGEVAKAATALCDAEYAVRGDCEIFGRFVDELKGAGLVPDDFEAELGT